MSKVLVAWEIGGGFGHLSYLAPLIQLLRAHGHEVAMVLPSPSYGQFLDIDLIEAPLSEYRYSVSDTRVNAGDSILARYSDWRGSKKAFLRWLEILEEEKPDRMVINHSPLALAAARAIEVPVMEYGTGYAVPKLGNPMPHWTEKHEKCAEQDWRATNRINAITGANLSSLSDLFCGEQRILCTVPEFDHYENRNADSYFGLIQQSFVNKQLPLPDGDITFHYFRYHTSALIPYFQALARVPGTHFVMSCRRYVNRENIVFLQEPVDLQPVFKRAQFIGTNGGHNLLLQSVSNGVPVISLPLKNSYEQRRNTENLEQLNAGFRLTSMLSREQLAEQMMHMDEYRNKAVTFAEKYKTPRKLEELLVFF